MQWIQDADWQPTVSSCLETADSKLVSLQCATKSSQAEPLSSGRRIKLCKCAEEPTSPAGPDLGKEHPEQSVCIQPPTSP